MNYEKALEYFAGDENFLKETLGIAYEDGFKKLDGLKNALESKDWKTYQLHVHSMKSSCAMFQIMPLSEHAKEHEIAAKENNIDFILSDSANLISEFETFMKETAAFLGK